MITLQDLCAYTDEMLDEDWGRDFCPNGLQIEGKKEIRSIATAVSASVEAIEKAASMSVDLLAVHHGIFWKNIEPRIQGPMKKKVQTLLNSDISLIAYHLPLDHHHEIGNNWLAAKEMGWKNLKAFDAYGVQGEVEGITPEKLLEQLESFYSHKAHHAPSSKKEIRKIALVSGGAHWSLKKAIEEGVDAFITGSFDEPMWHMAKESNTDFFALGHSATEEIGVKRLGEHLSEKFDLSHTFIESDNPF